jgi:DNA-binding NarL/FixJ family response regulator
MRLIPISVALVEDEPLTHERLCLALGKFPHIHLEYAANAAQPMMDWLQTKTSQTSPQVLLVDLGLPDRSGLEVIRFCKSIKPETQIMVITMFGDESNMIKAFEAGATGYLLKDGNEDELARHVQNLHEGGSPMSPIIARQLLLRMSQPQAASDKLPRPSLPASPSAERLLTDREEKVLQLLARGYSYAELAKLIGLSINTVQTHIKGLYAKLEVHSKSEAIFEAKQLGLLN